MLDIPGILLPRARALIGQLQSALTMFDGDDFDELER